MPIKNEQLQDGDEANNKESQDVYMTLNCF